MTEQMVSAVPEGPRRRWASWRPGGAVVVAGFCSAAVVRLTASGDWNDLVATKLLGLALGAAALLLLVATAASFSDSVRVRHQRWTPRTIAAVVLGLGLYLAGVGRMIITWDLGDPIARVLGQTAIIALIVFFVIGWLPLQHPRR